MTSDQIRYVHDHPPRCIAGLRPRPIQHVMPTLRQPWRDSVYYGQFDPKSMASFAVGCPCGCPTAYLLGYNVIHEDHPSVTVFVGPLRLECSRCGLISEFFDSRKHGYDGEQGVNTHMVGEGEPDRFPCPICGNTPFFICANFHFQPFEEFAQGMQTRPQDYFDTFAVNGQCVRCTSLVEIVTFECN